MITFAKIAAVALAATAFIPERAAADPIADANALCRLINERVGTNCKVLEWENAIEFTVNYSDEGRAGSLCSKIPHWMPTLTEWSIYIQSSTYDPDRKGKPLATCFLYPN